MASRSIPGGRIREHYASRMFTTQGCRMMENSDFEEVLEQVSTALQAMRDGDPEPYIDCWADTEDATLFGAWG